MWRWCLVIFAVLLDFGRGCRYPFDPVISAERRFILCSDDRVCPRGAFCQHLWANTFVCCNSSSFIPPPNNLQRNSDVVTTDFPSFYHQTPPELITAATVATPLFLTEPPTESAAITAGNDERFGPLVNYRQRYLQNVGRFWASLYQSTVTSQPSIGRISSRLPPIRYTLATTTEQREFDRLSVVTSSPTTVVPIDFRQDTDVQNNLVTEETQLITASSNSIPPLITYRSREISSSQTTKLRTTEHSTLTSTSLADLLLATEESSAQTRPNRPIPTTPSTIEETSVRLDADATFSIHVNYEGRIGDLDTQPKSEGRHNLAKIDSSIPQTSSASTTTTTSQSPTTTNSSTKSLTTKTVVKLDTRPLGESATASLRLDPNRNTFFYNIVIPYPIIKVHQRIGHPIASLNHPRYSTIDA